MQYYANPTQVLRGRWRWLAIVSYNAGATMQINDNGVFPIVAKYIIAAPSQSPWDSLQFTGSVSVILGENDDPVMIGVMT